MKSDDELIRKVNWQLNSVVRGSPDKLYKASNHLIQSGGKRIRPVLCLLSCESVGGNPDEALPSAAALELIHTFTLIHDDIMDNDDLRRGSPSVHKVYGNSTAILAGDLLFSKAFEICDDRVKRFLASASSEICEGQEMDVSFESRDSVPEEEYLEMIRKKTAVLFEASTKSGATIGCSEEKIVEEFGNYGMNLGMAFQVYDDVLGVAGDEKKLGKPVGSDIQQGKKNLVTLAAIERLSGEDRERFMKILMDRSNSMNDVEEAMGLIDKSGAIEVGKKKAEEYVKKAKAALKDVAGSDSKRRLIEIADFVINRDI